MDFDECFEAEVKDEITDESMMNEEDFSKQKCQDEMESHQDALPGIQDINPIIKKEDPDRSFGDDGKLDQLKVVKSNSCDEDKELICKKDNDDKDKITADEDDVEPDRWGADWG